MKNWASLHNHSELGSLLDGLSKPEQIIDRALEVNLSAIALSDHGSIRGVISLLNAKKKAGEKAKDLKVIAGNEFYVGNDYGNSHLVVLAKNTVGWQSLIKATSESNKRENFYRKPRLFLHQFEQFAKGNLLCFSGHPGSDLANVLFKDIKAAYASRTYDEVKALVKDDWKKDLLEKTDQYIQIFGRDNFFIEIQAIDEENFIPATLINKTLRWLSKHTGIPKVATADSHYPRHENNKDQWIILASAIGKTIPQITRQLVADDDDLVFSGFFRSNNYHIPSPEEITAVNTEDEIKCALEIAESIEEINPFRPISVPKFNSPNGDSNEYMRQLCREGWLKKNLNNLKGEIRQVYVDRIKNELDVLTEANLSDYFLIVRDIVEYVKSNDKLVGPGRGSAAGCLTSYLLGITATDPIQFDLIFERFYNAGRKGSLPDIDLDIQDDFGDNVIDYIKTKYGNNRVAQIGTFSRLMGRACLKEVLRCWEAASPKEMDKITQFIPDESSVSDDLQNMKEEEGESSIIKWALENNSKQLAEWAVLDKNTGRINGAFGKYFEQAIRLEGTHRNMGQHACGILIADKDLDELVPMRYNSEGQAIVDMSMQDAELCGLLKMDILRLACLGKIKLAEELIKSNWKDCI